MDGSCKLPTTQSSTATRLRHGPSSLMTRAQATNSRSRKREVSAPGARDGALTVDGELYELVDEFSDGRISYGCTSIKAEEAG
jgi:HEAT repeat protein